MKKLLLLFVLLSGCALPTSNTTSSDQADSVSVDSVEVVQDTIKN
tara:strand:+ start:774 stop:908 length:135 start_codon:yes stop_codon:yes gene_type:complete